MINALIRFWNYIVNHNVWNKVAASAIFGIAVWAWSNYKNINFWGVVVSIANFKLPLWVVAIIVILSIVIAKGLNKRKNTEKPSVNEGNTSPDIVSPLQKKLQIKHLIYDSQMEDNSWWEGYGQQNWEEGKGLYGEKGTGTWDFSSHILTLHRNNSEGRYIVSLKQCFYNGQLVNFIPKDLHAANPRNFSFSLRARSISGSHKVVLVFRRRDFSWIGRREFQVEHKGWFTFDGHFALDITEEAVIEFHTWTSNPNTTFQICDFVVMMKF